VGVSELRRDQSGGGRRREPKADEANEQRAADSVRVDCHGRSEHPLADRYRTERADDPANNDYAALRSWLTPTSTPTS
jgi:hypothetical protein